ncbi:MAG: hypothetical protein IJR92_03840, partial [Alphaproteobacteria bacterium]|nr:hypothetical protein [Alphaproteobacteria bacterium]
TEDWVYLSSSKKVFTVLVSDALLWKSQSGCLSNAFACTNGVPSNFDLTALYLHNSVSRLYIGFPEYDNNVDGFKQYLAQQYAAGTPVTIYYPLVEETTEDWTETSYCETPIKIATTKYNETAFSPLNTALANAISVVDSVVSNTITQAGLIADLQTQKQTRPNDIADDSEKCPAGKKCLLVEDASGVPHWYEIVERYSRLPDGYTELEYVSNAANTYLDTGIIPTVDNVVMEMKVKPTTGSWYIWQSRDPSNSVIHGFAGANTGSKISFAFPNASVATSTITRTGNILTMRSTMLNGQGKLYVHDDATNESDEQTTAYTFLPKRCRIIYLETKGLTRSIQVMWFITQKCI